MVNTSAPRNAAPTSAPSAAYEVRRVYRDVDNGIIAGVCAGIAQHLGLPVSWVRISLVAFSVFGGFGLLLYAGAWLSMRTGDHFADTAPGIAAATRSGKRQRPRRRLFDGGSAVAVVAVGFGGLLLGAQLLGDILVLWPVLTVALGVMVLWWQADQAQRDRWLDPERPITPLRAVVGVGGPVAWARLLGGVGLLVLGVMLFSLRGGDFQVSLQVGLATLICIVALAVVLGPLLFRLAADLSEERAERVRTQERADVAAHLHDSVLQTLALIQKSSTDPTMVVRLARSQERDLRTWLYDDTPADASSVAALLKRDAADIEDSTGIAVEIVCVGDRPMGPRGRALCGAAREAMLNAAKHSGTARVDVYAEIGELVEVFVRDRGVGFDPAGTASDRHGIRDSIESRMTRHGGSARVTSSPGNGAEVRLSMPAEETESTPQEDA